MVISKKYTNTLPLALDGLVSIECGKLPTDEQLHALQLAVWSWMDGENAVIPTELFKQGASINRERAKKYIALTTSLEMFAYMKRHNTSKSKAVENLSRGSERTKWTYVKKSPIKTEQGAERFNRTKAIVEKALQIKP